MNANVSEICSVSESGNYYNNYYITGIIYFTMTDITDLL